MYGIVAGAGTGSPTTVTRLCQSGHRSFLFQDPHCDIFRGVRSLTATLFDRCRPSLTPMNNFGRPRRASQTPHHS